eukprot:3130371-Prymnesium_polylepis.1
MPSANPGGKAPFWWHSHPVGACTFARGQMVADLSDLFPTYGGATFLRRRGENPVTLTQVAKAFL